MFEIIGNFPCTLKQLLHPACCRYGNKNLYILVSGLARRLLDDDCQLAAFMSMQKIAEVVGPKQFLGYINKLTTDQKRIYDELAANRNIRAETPATQVEPFSLLRMFLQVLILLSFGPGWR